MSVRVSTLRLALSASAFALAAVSLSSPAAAATCVWNGGTGNWSPAGGWSACAEPTSSDDVAILIAGSVVNLNGLTSNAGTINLGSGNALSLNNSFLSIFANVVTNNGTITIGGNSQFRSGSGIVTFGGTGTIAMSTTGGYAHIGDTGGGFVFGGGQTVRGAGDIGLNQAVLSNAGLISADVLSATLLIDAAGGNGGVSGGGFGTSANAGLFNSSTMQATGGGTLAFAGGLYENSAAGVIRALAGSTVALNGDSRIVGGTLTSVGTGQINAYDVVQYLTSVTLSSGSKLDVANDFLGLNTSLVNNGTVTIRGNSQLRAESTNLTISGTGTIVLDDSAGYAHIGDTGGFWTLGSNQTITGSGDIGLNQAAFTNNFLLSTGSASNLRIDVAGGNGGFVGGLGSDGTAGFLNNGTIRANSASTIAFAGGQYDNRPGLISAIGGSTIALNGDSRIVGGTLTSDATSSFNAFGTTQYLTNVTLSAGSRLDVANDFLALNTSLVNNGTVTIRGNSQLRNETGNLTISGAGTIVLDNSGGYAHIGDTGGYWTLGSNQTITGSGDIGLNQSVFTNNFLFSTGSASNLSIDVAGGNGGLGVGLGVGADMTAGFLNNGTIRANSGSTISFQGGQYDNRPGLISAIGGSTINLNGDSRIVGGTLTTDATSAINAFGTSQYLTSVTLSSGSKLDVANDFLGLNTSLVNNGTVTIRGNSQLRAESTNLTISGTGTIVLDDSAGYAHIGDTGGFWTLGSNQTITGSGDIGLNQAAFTNNFLLSTGSGSNLRIDVAGGNGGFVGGLGSDGTAGFLNNGTIRANSASTIAFAGGQYDNRPGLISAIGGSTIALNGDSRIVGGTLTSDATSSFNAFGTTQYLTNVTLSAGSRLDVANDFLALNTSLVNNGTVTIRGNSQLRNETGNLTISGAGTIVLDNSGGYAHIGDTGGYWTLGSGQTVRGAGDIGLNQAVFTNNGFISADAGGGISIDVAGGNGGLSGGGVGTGNNAGLFNTGTIQGANGQTLSISGGQYENSATGIFGAAGAGSVFAMNGDASLLNLNAAGVLALGTYVSSTTGAASTLNLRSNAANSIATIGAAAVGTDTVVTLSGANSVFNVTNFSSGINTTLDSTLTTLASSGRLNVLGSRNLTIVAGGGAFTNAGIVQLGGGTFGSASYANSGLTTGFGTIGAPISNGGTVEAAGGTLFTKAIIGPVGTMRSLSGATLDISGAVGNSTAAFLANGGTLALGTRNVTVTSDYTNTGFGSGNAFAAHANVSGSGLINATSATMDLSGPNLTGNILNVGSVRTGGSSSTVLTITNNGTATTLRGAVQNTLAPSVALAGADWVIGPNGGSTNVTISYTGLSAGTLSGQTLGVVNNFDNVADQSIGLAGNVYQVAQAGTLPSSITLGARRVGDAAATAGFSIANVAPVTPGFNEDLRAATGVGSGFTLNGSGTATIGPVSAGSSVSVALSHGTGTAGAFSSIVSIANTSLAVAGSGLSDLALAGQSINVLGNVYQTAIATLGGTSVNFGAVRKNAVSPTGNIGVTNSATGTLVDTLLTSTSSLPAGVSATSPAALAAGQSGSVSFSLNTGTSGIVNGTGSLNFMSHDTELADKALTSQSVSFTGTVTELARGAIFKNGGLGTFGGSGNAFTLDLGSLATNSGVFTTDFGVNNLVVPSAFAELLGGSFTQGSGSGYLFAGNSFSGLVGGTSNTGNLLNFDTTGLANGTYTKQVTFNGFSSFTGLGNVSLTPINVSITANVTGNVGNAVPEPASWMMMLFGFALVGSAARRSKLAGTRQLI